MTATRLFSYALILIVLSYNIQAFADNESSTQPSTWYSIEYLIFENKSLSNQTLEPWTSAAFKIPDNAIRLSNLSSNTAFKPLAPNQQQLYGVYNRLEKLSSYTPIAHAGWVQPLQQKGERKPVQISHQTGPLQLEGTLTFHRGRFLHLDIDLQLSEMNSLAITQTNLSQRFHEPVTLYRLTETRRIKTDESHYFDHPRFGVLAIVKKIDSPN